MGNKWNTWAGSKWHSSICPVLYMLTFHRSQTTWLWTVWPVVWAPSWWWAGGSSGVSWPWGLPAGVCRPGRGGGGGGEGMSHDSGLCVHLLFGTLSPGKSKGLKVTQLFPEEGEQLLYLALPVFVPCSQPSQSHGVFPFRVYGPPTSSHTVWNGD